MYKQQMGAAQQELHLHRQSCQSQLLISFLLNCGASLLEESFSYVSLLKRFKGNFSQVPVLSIKYSSEGCTEVVQFSGSCIGFTTGAIHSSMETKSIHKTQSIACSPIYL